MTGTEPIFTKRALVLQSLYTVPTKEFHKNPTNGLVADTGSQTNRQTARRELHVRYSLCYFLQNAYNPVTANSLSQHVQMVRGSLQNAVCTFQAK
jgi:hypothetical protein